MSIQYLEPVVLTQDVTDRGLRSGELGTVVEVLPLAAVDLEFVTVAGRTRACLMLNIDQVQPVTPLDIPTVGTAEPLQA